MPVLTVGKNGEFPVIPGKKFLFAPKVQQTLCPETKKWLVS
jgi:hypothetical protein